MHLLEVEVAWFFFFHSGSRFPGGMASADPRDVRNTARRAVQMWNARCGDMDHPLTRTGMSSSHRNRRRRTQRTMRHRLIGVTVGVCNRSVVPL